MATKVWKMGMAVDQLIADTVDLSDDEFGKYMRILFFAWKHEAELKLTDEDIDTQTQRISNICKNPDNNKTKYILNRFFLFDKEKNSLFSKAQREEWERVQEISYQARQNAMKKWQKTDKNDDVLSQSDGNASYSKSKSKSNSKTDSKNILFEEFWDIIKYKKNKQEAKDQFMKIDLSKEKLNHRQIAEKYNEEYDNRPDWQSPKYVQGWLSKKRWLNEMVITPQELQQKYSIAGRFVKQEGDLFVFEEKDTFGNIQYKYNKYGKIFKRFIILYGN